jgi:hypothetical protein
MCVCFEMYFCCVANIVIVVTLTEDSGSDLTRWHSYEAIDSFGRCSLGDVGYTHLAVSWFSPDPPGECIHYTMLL